MTDHIPTTSSAPEAIPAAAPAAPAAPARSAGWSITGLVLGIITVLLGLIPFFGFIALGPAPFGIVASIVGIKVGAKRGMAITGLILAIVGVIIGLLMSIGLMMALSGAGPAEFFTVSTGATEVSAD